MHEPRQSPEHYYDSYNESIADDGRRQFAGMLAALDEGLKNISQTLHTAAMYTDTLFIVTTDNGGPTTECSTTGQSNWPLRGSKCSIWEGGTRGSGFLYWHGLPELAHGLLYTGLFHGKRGVSNVLRPVLTDIYLCHACSCLKLRMETPRGSL